MVLRLLGLLLVVVVAGCSGYEAGYEQIDTTEATAEEAWSALVDQVQESYRIETIHPSKKKLETEWTTGAGSPTARPEGEEDVIRVKGPAERIRRKVVAEVVGLPDGTVRVRVAVTQQEYQSSGTLPREDSFEAYDPYRRETPGDMATQQAYWADIAPDKGMANTLLDGIQKRLKTYKEEVKSRLEDEDEEQKELEDPGEDQDQPETGPAAPPEEPNKE